MTAAGDSATIAPFIARWRQSSGAERANYQLFLSELCDALGVERPHPAGQKDAPDAYVFERAVTFHHADGSTSPGRIDLYKRGCFVLEAKQSKQRGSKAWDDAMLAARGQAEQYAKALPAEEGWPPLLIVVDVGHSIELFADFTGTGKAYVPFPDPRGFRIGLAELERAEPRERLRLAWTEPLSLDPARRTARVTREVAARLAALAKSLEASGHAPKSVAAFLMRCLFTMFAEDVGLIPKDGFSGLLTSLRETPEKFPPLAKSLWRTMNEGGFSPVLRETLRRFNGSLFEDAEAIALDRQQLDLLIEASRSDWRDVEPAIFGTLLERALDPRERHKLGAHYTPRAYVERLVLPTLVEPLREDWSAAKTAAVTLAKQGKLDEARAQLREFHRKLCATRVLDPACGSGNFLYVALEHMKRLEGEALAALEEFGEAQAALELSSHTVDPHQFLGIEVNPRAAEIAEIVLWIGFLQWHFRTNARVQAPDPVLRKFKNIEHRDAVLAWDKVELVRDAHGKPATRWDGVTMKKHPVTGEDVPDETARVELHRYVNPRPAAWPEAEFVVGNPPFIGNKYMRQSLGDGYAEALRNAHAGVPESSDYVMYWWDHAAMLAREGSIRRFGLITTNSLRQTFNRRVVQTHLSARPPLSLLFAIADHPWVDAADGAAVRISMTVGAVGERTGRIQQVIKESEPSGDGTIEPTFETREGRILPNVAIGVDVASATSLSANSELCSPGVKLHGAGFIVTPEKARQLGLGRIVGLERHIREYRHGRDVTDQPRGVMVIDFHSLDLQQVSTRFPEAYQHILERVKPERQHNNRESYRDNWWIFGEPRSELRPALIEIQRFVVTPATSKHRFFQFLPIEILPDDALINIAVDDAFFLGVLSSRAHVTWALAAGGTLEDRPRYNKTRCFDPFPFPACDEGARARIRELGERLDAHRKRQQALHPGLTMTGMYNVLAKLRAGAALSAKERAIHEQGLVSVLREIHDALDAAVFAAYGWPASLGDEAILEKLVALNAERAAEEGRGLVRWLRPDYQAPKAAIAAAPTQRELEIAAAPAAAAGKKQPWPKAMAEQVVAIRHALAGHKAAATPKEIARAFKGARVDRIEDLLETLASLGQARDLGQGRYVA